MITLAMKDENGRGVGRRVERAADRAETWAEPTLPPQ